MFRSLQFRLLLTFAVVIAVVLGAVALFANETSSGELEQQEQFRRGKFDRGMQLSLAQHYWLMGGWAEVQTPIEMMARISGERLVLVDMDGTVLADSELTLNGQSFPEDWTGREIPVIVGNQPMAIVYESPGPEGESGEAGGFESTVGSSLLWAALIAGAVTLVLTFFLSRRILHPISALTSAARKLGRGDLSQRVKVKSRDEVGELATTFNAMADELERTEQLRRSMVADAAHELRTPLTNIRGYLEAIKDGVIKADAGTIESMHEEALLLTHLADDLQELALVDAGELRLDVRADDVAEIVRKAVAAIQPQATAKQISVETKLAPDLSPVMVDAERIGQVLRNLLSNAVAYTPEGGEVSVLVRSLGEWVEVRVADSGIGIAAGDMPFIFERFYRADKSRSRATGGVGLGLTIIKRLVEAHGGSIEVHSEEGRGSTFVFTVPRA
jgi:signal transduction histidine kinase